ncbi:MAG: hypothetical protein JWP75_3139 [Frondihabitans sp.]|nr:hypothetical protein [Frondihabitans sp.]
MALPIAQPNLLREAAHRPANRSHLISICYISSVLKNLLSSDTWSSRRLLLLIPTLGIATLLSGCGATPAASISTTSEATSTATSPTGPTSPSPHAPEISGTTTLRLEAGRLTVTGTQSAALSSADLPASLADLTKLLGDPTVTPSSGQAHCSAAGTTYDWKGALNIFAPSGGAPYETRLLARSTTALDGTEVKLTGPENVRVGDDVARLISSTPESHKVTYEADGSTATTVLIGPVETAADEADGTRGVAAFTEGTRVRVIGWPVPVHSNDDC